MFDANGETKVRWILDRVSSGNCAKVAEVNQVRGTRSQRVSGLAEWCPVRVRLCMTGGEHPNLLDADVLSYRNSASSILFSSGISTTYRLRPQAQLPWRVWKAILADTRIMYVVCHQAWRAAGRNLEFSTDSADVLAYKTDGEVEESQCRGDSRPTMVIGMGVKSWI